MNPLNAVKVIFHSQIYMLFASLCQAQDHCGDYYCEQGTCCGDRLCCTHYYYKTWWFWIIWCIVALLCCCCFYQKRRFQEKIRERMLRAYRDAQLMPGQPGSPTGPYSPPEDQNYFNPIIGQGQQVKLPAYDEISEIPKDPPAYDVICNESNLPESRISGERQYSEIDRSHQEGATMPIPGSSSRERHDTENSGAPLLGDSDQELDESCQDQHRGHDNTPRVTSEQ